MSDDDAVTHACDLLDSAAIHVGRRRRARTSTAAFAAEKSAGAGSRDSCRKTCSNAFVVLCGSCCWQRPTSRSTSAGSVTSVSVSAPLGVSDTSTSLLPTRSKFGKLPRRERHAAEHAHDVGRQRPRRLRFLPPRRNSHANSRNAPITTASAVPIVYIDSSGTPNHCSDVGRRWPASVVGERGIWRSPRRRRGAVSLAPACGSLRRAASTELRTSPA